MRRARNVFPKGWDERRVRRLIEHYDRQTEDDAVKEYEAAQRQASQTVMTVPTPLVPAIRAFIASATTRGHDEHS
jgi:hypothetical protein